MTVAERTYETLALKNPKRPLELHRGVLQEKPAMAYGHNFALRELDRMLILQLDPRRFKVSVNATRVRLDAETVFIPDLFVFPVSLTEGYRGRREALEVYTEPLPLVVEIWSSSTGDYDIDAKIPTYRSRGDLEIWRLHPYERTLTAWRRQPDGSYTEAVYHGGTIDPAALPGVTIDIDALFD